MPIDNRFKNNENVFPFSANLASLEVLQFVALATGAGGKNDFGIQRYRYWPGNMETDSERTCNEGCDCATLIGQGDRYFSLFGRDPGAELARSRQRAHR
jgi:hypothetical protein